MKFLGTSTLFGADTASNKDTNNDGSFKGHIAFSIHYIEIKFNSIV